MLHKHRHQYCCLSKGKRRQRVYITDEWKTWKDKQILAIWLYYLYRQIFHRIRGCPSQSGILQKPQSTSTPHCARHSRKVKEDIVISIKSLCLNSQKMKETHMARQQLNAKPWTSCHPWAIESHSPCVRRTGWESKQPNLPQESESDTRQHRHEMKDPPAHTSLPSNTWQEPLSAGTVNHQSRAALREEKFIFRMHRCILSLQRQWDIRAKSGTGKKIDCLNPKQLALTRFIIFFLNCYDFSAGGSARLVALETAACWGDRYRMARGVSSSHYPCQ